MKACKRAVDLIHMPTIAGPLPLLKTSIMAIRDLRWRRGFSAKFAGPSCLRDIALKTTLHPVT